MVKIKSRRLSVIGSGVVVFGFACFAFGQLPDEEHGDEPELAAAMAQLQYFTHKLALSVEARNTELARFYLHETEEMAELIRDDIPEYEGMAIGPLVDAMLMPLIEQLEERLDQPEWQAVDHALSATVQSCNACHEVTEHGFIVIEFEPGFNPYMQSFQPNQSAP